MRLSGSAGGVALHHSGRYAEALGAYDQALALDLHRAEARYNKALIFETQGRYSEALATLERGFDPDDPRDWWDKARKLRALG
jgi:tetratricopeptide (TPR) repeat protein